jgi:hypothetical protein
VSNTFLIVLYILLYNADTWIVYIRQPTWDKKDYKDGTQWLILKWADRQWGLYKHIYLLNLLVKYKSNQSRRTKKLNRNQFKNDKMNDRMIDTILFVVIK